jgi:hypothetical protein
MIDLKNKRIYKIMCMPGEYRIIWDVMTEEPIFRNADLYEALSEEIDFKKWRNKYAIKNKNLFQRDDDSIYQLKNPINLDMVNALLKLNEKLEDIIIYYWFDIDRTLDENFKWTHCPLSKERLIDLGPDYPKINSFVSMQFPLIFPSLS